MMDLLVVGLEGHLAMVEGMAEAEEEAEETSIMTMIIRMTFKVEEDEVAEVEVEGKATVKVEAMAETKAQNAEAKEAEVTKVRKTSTHLFNSTNLKPKPKPVLTQPTPQTASSLNAQNATPIPCALSQQSLALSSSHAQGILNARIL